MFYFVHVDVGYLTNLVCALKLVSHLHEENEDYWLSFILQIVKCRQDERI